MKHRRAGKELYQQLRALPWPQLWEEEVPQFDQASDRERFERVAVIRAVGAAFAEGGATEPREEVRQWLRRLLHDPQEKIRRYAIAALPKLGAGAGDEAELLSLLRRDGPEREKKILGRTLERIGGAATLEVLESTGAGTVQTQQKIRASVARLDRPSAIRLDRTLPGSDRLRLHLRGRRGLEDFVREEVMAQGKFRVVEVKPGLVVVSARVPFTLADVFALRCFGTVSFSLGLVSSGSDRNSIKELAAVIVSTQARQIFTALTQGAIRYRLDFLARGHQRALVRRVAERVYELCPDLLNDAREVPWAIDIYPAERADSVELRPRLGANPRLAHRLDDLPASSHPALAACLARLAGRRENESIWDPFCGSGLELIERALLGGVRRVYGTDRSAEAIAITKRNFAAAPLASMEAHFICGDFRALAQLAGLAPGSLSLIISNPPLGRRVPVPDLRGLFNDLFAVAATLLAPGGRLVFVNPFLLESPQPSLKLQSRRVVDLGGFNCRLEEYHKLGS